MRRGLTAYSVLQVHRLFHRAFTHAFHLGLVKRNLALLVYPPRPQRRPQTAFSAEQLLLLLERTRGDRLYPLWVLLSRASLRIGEALGLRWQDLGELQDRYGDQGCNGASCTAAIAPGAGKGRPALIAARP